MISAEVAVPAPRGEVFAFLARLENHWELADRWIEVVHLDSDHNGGGAVNGGAVRVRGPLGMSRIARTRVAGVEPPGRIHGVAEVGGRTRAAIDWSLSARDPAALPPGPAAARTRRSGSSPAPGEVTWVRLEAEIVAIGALDAALLALGGRHWMRRRFDVVLAGLARRFAAA